MKKHLHLISALLLVSLTTFSQHRSLSLNDSLIGFDEKSVIAAAPHRGIIASEMPVYLAINQRDFLKQKYNLRSEPAPKMDYPLNAKANAAICVNEDFEEASLSSPVPGTLNITTASGINGWSGSSGLHPGTATGSCLLTGCCSGAPNTMSVIAPGSSGLFDPIIGPSYPIHSVYGASLNANATAVNGFPSYGNWFVKLNDANPGGGLSRLTKTISVTPSNVYFNFAYIAVVQGAHCCCDNDGVSLIFKDCLGNTLASSSQDSIATLAGGGCTPVGTCASPSTIAILSSTTSAGAGWYYSQWINANIDLSLWLGTCITVEVTAMDCAYGGHAGYAYFDAQCASTIINGTKSLSLNYNYHLYPNPNSGNFTIEIPGELNNGEIEIRNILGQIVHKQPIKQGSNSIRTENLAKGIYNYSVMQSKEVMSKGKLIVE